MKRSSVSGALPRLSKSALHRVEGWFEAAFGAANPFYYLGALGCYFFYIVVVTGIYLIIYYEPTVTGSYDRLQYLTREQWYLGGIMRSLHRYASDAMVLVMALHILREWVMGRHRGKRWFSWVTGIPVLIMLYLSGIVGFLMVWDRLAQYLAERSAEWFDWLSVFTSPIARNFLTSADVTDMFFRLLIILHIGLPLFLQACLLLHVKKISRARILPPRPLALGTFAALLVLSLLYPTVSQERADLSRVAGILHLDWYYMFLYPLMDLWSMGAVWALVAGATALLAALPWLPPKRKEPVAVVDLANCNGCGFCAQDCPYEAIAIQPRSDGRPTALREAVVNADNCVSCGICAGACPFSMPFRHVERLATGIDLPQRDVQHLRDAVHGALDRISGETRILVFGCEHGADVTQIDEPGVAALRLACIAALPPSFIAYALRQGADGVILAGCRQGDCYHRLGDQWLRERLRNERRPALRRSVDASRIGLCWAAPTDRNNLRRTLEALQRTLRDAPPRGGPEDRHRTDGEKLT